MTVISPSKPPTDEPFHWTSLFQLVLSAFTAFVLLAAAGIFIFSGITQYFSHGADSAVLLDPFMLAGSLVFAGMLVIPSAWYAWKHIAYPAAEPVSRPLRRNFGLILTIIVLIGTSLALLVGNLVAQNDQVAWLVLPFLNILATGLPAMWIIYFGTRGLLPNSPRHTWGVFAVGLTLGPLIILFLELILLIVVGVLVIGWITLSTGLPIQFNSLMLQLQNAGNDTQAILNSVLPYLLNPVVVFIGFAFVSILVPIIEETLKPIGVWFMVANKITPAQGFAFGVLSGAGFGIFENLGNTSGAGADWALLAGARISTLLLHSFTAGLVGWGLASAWSQRRFLRLALSFTAAVLIHGFWNAMAVLTAVSSLQGVSSVQLPAYLQQIGVLATAGILVLGLLVIFGFFGFNAYLRRTASLSSPPTALDSSFTASESASHPFIDEASASQSDTTHFASSQTSAVSSPLASDPHPSESGENPPTNTETTS